MDVFLTGASGYIGRSVAQALRRGGHKLTGLARSDKSAKALEALGVTPVRGSMEDEKILWQAARDADGVIHMAADEGAERAQLDAAVVDTLVDALRDSNKVLVYTSGCFVYGDTGGRTADESTPVNPPPLVAWRPAQEQKVLRSPWFRGIVLRPAMVYGGGAGILEGFFAKPAREGGPVRVIDGGQNRWSCVHVEDLADLYVRALERAFSATILNASQGEPVTVRAIAEAAVRAAGGKAAIVDWPPAEARQALGGFGEALAMSFEITSQRAMDTLGWQPKQPNVLEVLAAGR